VLVPVIVGAGLVVASGLIHLLLWGEPEGYRHVPTVGPLFLAQGIGGCILGVLLVVLRWLAVVLAAVAYLAASIGGLAVSVRWGLFGCNETMNAPFAGLALGVEIAGLAVLVLVAGLLIAPATNGGCLLGNRLGEGRRAKGP